MTTSEADFVFAVCQAGAETALKRELGRTRPELRFAFSRPGFLTFRGSGFTPEVELASSVFARAFGISLGKARAEAPEKATDDLATAVLEKGRAIAAEKGSSLRLHVFERDRHPPGEEPKDFRSGEWAGALKATLGKCANESPFQIGELAQPGDLIFDVVLVEANEIWFGLHRHSAAHSPYPGGNPRLELPADAPSRAWLKLEEAIRFPGAPIQKGDIAIELGSAPGGAALALVSRGVKTYGVDAGEMSGVVRAKPGFTWLCASAKEALAGQGGASLPKSAEWLVLDIHARGELALRELEPYVERYRPELLGMVLTLKLGNWEMAELIPRWLEKVRAMGMVSVRAAHLPSNKQEFCVVALTEKGRATRG